MMINMVSLLNFMTMSRSMLNIVLACVHFKSMLASVSGTSVCSLMLMSDYWKMSNVMRMEM